MGRKLFIAAVLLILLLPVALMPFHVDITSYQAQSAGPITSASSLEAHFALRAALITWRSRLLSLVGESGTDQVYQGRDMLFYDGELADYLGTNALSEEELTVLADSLAGLAGQLDAEGRRLIVLLAPNKSTIYPEAMPARYLPTRQPTNLLRLQEALSDRDVEYLDARRILLDGKSDERVYYAGDTHWNTHGAFLLYRALMERLALPVSFEGVSAAEGKAGDLIVMMQPGSSPIEPDTVPDIARVYKTTRPGTSSANMRVETLTDADTPSLLVVRDSFGEALFPYLANSISRMVYSRIYEDVLGQAREADAEIVLLEIVERNIGILSVD